MKYNSDIHRRRSIRLKNYDYSREGAYFLTLCTYDRGSHFEQFEPLRRIVEAQWHSIPERFSGVLLDEYVIMPNHVHGIIFLCGDPGVQGGCAHHKNHKPARGAPTLGDIVGSFKSLCVHAWLKFVKSENINTRGKFWQDNYFEHVIRDDGELERIRRYIAENPLRWDLDRENPEFDNSQEMKQMESWMV
jgi:REP element-mobilizing transposase RayT